MRNWTILICSMIFLTAWTGGPPHISINTPKTFKELPVMRVNVYMMGREEVDESISVKIFENIEYMNEAFQGQIAFVFNELFMDPNHAYLPDIYQSYRIFLQAMKMNLKIIPRISRPKIKHSLMNSLSHIIS